MRWPVTSNPKPSRRVNALRSGRSEVVVGMSRSFRWTVSEPPSSKDLGPYTITIRRTPPNTPTPLHPHMRRAGDVPACVLRCPLSVRGRAASVSLHDIGGQRASTPAAHQFPGGAPVPRHRASTPAAHQSPGSAPTWQRSSSRTIGGQRASSPAARQFPGGAPVPRRRTSSPAARRHGNAARRGPSAGGAPVPRHRASPPAARQSPSGPPPGRQ